MIFFSDGISSARNWFKKKSAVAVGTVYRKHTTYTNLKQVIKYNIFLVYTFIMIYTLDCTSAPSPLVSSRETISLVWTNPALVWINPSLDGLNPSLVSLINFSSSSFVFVLWTTWKNNKVYFNKSISRSGLSLLHTIII